MILSNKAALTSSLLLLLLRSQFRRHVNTFRNVYTETPWEHYGWIAKQYVILAQMLIKLSVKSPNQDSDPWLYFHNAALWELKRRDSYLRSSASLIEDDKTAAKRFAGLEVRRKQLVALRFALDEQMPTHEYLMLLFLLAASEYVGGAPQLVDPVLGQPVEQTPEVAAYLRQLMLRREQEVDHSAIAHSLLEKSIELVPPRYKRRLAFLRSLLGDEAMAVGAYRVSGCVHPYDFAIWCAKLAILARNRRRTSNSLLCARSCCTMDGPIMQFQCWKNWCSAHSSSETPPAISSYATGWRACMRCSRSRSASCTTRTPSASWQRRRDCLMYVLHSSNR